MVLGTPLKVGCEDPTFRIIFVHGFAVHKRPYAHIFGKLLGTRGEALLYDLPGHGESTAPFTRRQLALLSNQIAQDVTMRSRVPLLLAGESLGCVFLDLFARGLANHGLEPSGYMLYAPPLILNIKSIVTWAVAGLQESPRPSPLSFSLERALRDCISDDQALLALKVDPLVKNRVGLVYLWRSFNHVSSFTPRLRRLKAPTLLVQGSDDPLIVSWSLAAALALCGARAKSAIEINGGRHSLFWDVGVEHVISSTQAWLAHHVPMNGEALD